MAYAFFTIVIPLLKNCFKSLISIFFCPLRADSINDCDSSLCSRKISRTDESAEPSIRALIMLINSTGTWQHKGCYVNQSPKRALPVSFDNSVSGNQGNRNVFEHCRDKAESFGYKLFGADNKNCWSGNDAENTYDDHGVSSECYVNNQGYGVGSEINGDMFVYRYH